MPIKHLTRHRYTAYLVLFYQNRPLCLLPLLLHYWPLFLPPFTYLLRESGKTFTSDSSPKSLTLLKINSRSGNLRKRAIIDLGYSLLSFSRVGGFVEILYLVHSITPIYPQRICIQPCLYFPHPAALQECQRCVNSLSCCKALDGEFVLQSRFFIFSSLCFSFLSTASMSAFIGVNPASICFIVSAIFLTFSL